MFPDSERKLGAFCTPSINVSFSSLSLFLPFLFFGVLRVVGQFTLVLPLKLEGGVGGGGCIVGTCFGVGRRVQSVYVYIHMTSLYPLPSMKTVISLCTYVLTVSSSLHENCCFPMYIK